MLWKCVSLNLLLCSCLQWSPTYCKDGSLGWAGHGLQLIDFGRAVDTSLLPEGTTFSGHSRTDGFECIEMKDNRPWTKQVLLVTNKRQSHIFLCALNFLSVGSVWCCCYYLLSDL